MINKFITYLNYIIIVFIDIYIYIHIFIILFLNVQVDETLQKKKHM